MKEGEEEEGRYCYFLRSVPMKPLEPVFLTLTKIKIIEIQQKCISRLWGIVISLLNRVELSKQLKG